MLVSGASSQGAADCIPDVQALALAKSERSPNTRASPVYCFMVSGRSRWRSACLGRLRASLHSRKGRAGGGVREAGRSVSSVSYTQQ